MDNNDYTSLDCFFPPVYTTRVINEDAEPASTVDAVSPSVPIINPPAEAIPPVNCPLCNTPVTAVPGEKGTYKCDKCGKSFVIKEEAMEEDKPELTDEMRSWLKDNSGTDLIKSLNEFGQKFGISDSKKINTLLLAWINE